MSNSGEPSPSSVATSVWPPPPSTAPEIFTVEGVTVAKTGEQLYVGTSEPSFKVGSTIVSVILIWAVAMSLQFYSRYYSNPPAPFWQDKNFLLKIWEITCLMVCSTPLLIWQEQWEARRKKDQSTFIFHQQKKQINSSVRFGGGTGVVTSLVIRRYSTSTWSQYAIQFRLDSPNRSLFGKRSIATFRKLENAECVARLISEFLNVPVENGST